MDCAAQPESQHNIRSELHLISELLHLVERKLMRNCGQMNSGLGLLPVSFDWTQITYAGIPLTTPFYITCNAFAVVVIFYIFLSPILYYANVWNSA